jgi:hypothetical protein
MILKKLVKKTRQADVQKKGKKLQRRMSRDCSLIGLLVQERQGFE